MLIEEDLPDDVEALRALTLAQARELDALKRFQAEVERLKAIIAALQRHRFGRRSEQLDPDQFELALKEVETALAEAEHVRRKFHDLADTSPVATEVLRRIALLYAIEGDVRGVPAEQRQAIRSERTRAIVEDLRQYLEARNRQVSAKAKLGQAIRYALTRWDGLIRFLDDGRVDLDSNTVERSIRPLALNRKNALFAGSDEGGDNWAVIATLIENCKISGIDPHRWLAETLTKLANGHHANRVHELMPWAAVG